MILWTSVLEKNQNINFHKDCYKYTVFLLCRRSSVVEHTLGKGGVGSSILLGGTKDISSYLADEIKFYNFKKFERMCLAIAKDEVHAGDIAFKIWIVFFCLTTTKSLKSVFV